MRAAPTAPRRTKHECFDVGHVGSLSPLLDMGVLAAPALGGSVRVGLEDNHNLYLPDGTMARSDGGLVACARRMTQDTGRRPATVAEARRMLGA